MTSTTFVQSVQTLLLRDLDKLEREISSYPTTASLWKIEKQISNSAGTLCLHLCGNLQHFIGAILGQSGYVRDREKEFSLRDVSQKELVLQIIETKDAIRKAFEKLSESNLQEIYPVTVFDAPMTVHHFLVHLHGHLNYHLGQINYHRRLIGA